MEDDYFSKKRDIENSCLHAYLLRSVASAGENEQSLSKKQWKKTIELILNEPMLRGSFKRIGESKNELFEIESEGMINYTFIFKRRKNKSELEEEYKKSTFLYNLFRNDNASEPLEVIEHD